MQFIQHGNGQVGAAQVNERLQLVSQKVGQIIYPQEIGMRQIVRHAVFSHLPVLRILENLCRLEQRGQHVEMHAFGDRAAVAIAESASALIAHFSAEVIGCPPGRILCLRLNLYSRQETAQNLACVKDVGLAIVGAGKGTIGPLDAQQPADKPKHQLPLTIMEKGRYQVASHFRVCISMVRMHTDAAGGEFVGTHPF